MAKIVLVAESGSDISPELAKEYGIHVVPMHVTFDDETFDDGSFPVEKIVEFYRNGKKLPKTSGSNPEDFTPLFDRIHAEDPDAQILYLAYSAVTTVSYQSGVIAAEDRDYVTCIDTKQVSAGQGMIAVEMARILRANPEMTLEEAVAAAYELIDRAKMCFVPDNLEFLRAGGRVSNVVALVGGLLGIHPCIEIIDGKLTATRKFRGKMTKVAGQLISEYAEAYNLDRKELWFVYTVGMGDDVKAAAAAAAKEAGFASVQWIRANGVITTHGGPGAFGMAGFNRKHFC